MATCNVNDLLADAGAIAGLTPGQRRVLIAQLLYDISGSTSTVAELLAEANCLMCLTPGQLRVVQGQLLCNWSGDGGGGYQPPVATGDFPNDDFESYPDQSNLKDKNGGENGNSGFTISWESDYAVFPYGADIVLTSPDGVLNLEQWVAADEITGVDDEEALDTWEDLTANNRDFTAVGAQRPTYQTGELNGMPGVLFNNVAGVGMTGAYTQSAGNFSVIVVYRSASLASTANRRCVQGANNWLIGPYGGYNRVFTGGGFLDGSYPTITPVVMAISQTATTSIRAYLNGALFGTGTASLVQPGLLSLGATGGANEPANCHIFEVAVYSRALTEDEIVGISWGLMLKWGLATGTGFDF